MGDWDVVSSAPVPAALKRDPLALRVEQQESRGDPNARNPDSGAIGSMQTLPSTLKDPGYGVRPAQDNTPKEMTRVGDDYLSAMKKKYGNDTLALAAYNWGPGHVDTLVAKGQHPDKIGVESFKKLLPAETQGYITNIQKNDWKVVQNAPTPQSPSAATPTSTGWEVKQQAPIETPKVVATPANGTEWLASISEPSINAGANLISGAIAPFLSDKSKKILQDKGLYTPGESPLKEWSQAAYGTITAPIQPLINKVAEKAQKAGEATVGKKATNIAGDLISTGMDIAGFAVPGLAKKGEVPTPLSIETKLTELEKKHDATTDPKKQAKIKQQMMDVVNEHPEAEYAKREAEKYNPPAPPEKSLPAQAAQGGWNVVHPQGAGALAEDTAGTIRAETGTANRQTAQAEAHLAESYNKAAEMTPAQQNDFYQYVEGRSKGAELADPTLQKMADDTRNVMQTVRSDIESLPEGDRIGFYEDYFPHQFKNPEQARAFSNSFVSKQGSSGSLKARKYPTLADAQAAGLELVDNNPIRAASRYATSMNNYIASKRIVTQVIDKGDAKYYAPGKQPEGWVPLTGRFAERTRAYTKEIPTEVTGGEPDIGAAALHEKLYAPAEVARVYNNFYSRGLEATDLAKPYEIGRTLNAANTAAELGLSAYHMGTITGQLMASDISRVFKNALVGDWKGVGKAALSATAGQIPFVKGSAYKIGKKVIGQYKGLENHGIDMESIAEHFERGGGKVGQEKLYRPSEQGGLFTGKGGIKQSVRDIKEQWGQKGLTPKAKASLEVFQRATEDVSYPLFEKYIPSVKTGSFANLMGDWLRQNPEATDAQIKAARQKYVDLVDDRFGEMNMDNVFWHKYLKQTASLFLRAQGWDIGLVRQAGGGVLDTVKILQNAFKGKKIPENLIDRPAFLASVIATMAMMSAAYQYMKTGQAPNEMIDYFAPRTGGTSTRGTPERTLLPTAAHGRELVHIAAPFASEGTLGTESPHSGLAQEASNKISSFPRNVYQAYENEDYFGNKLGETTGPSGWMGSVPARVGHVAEGFLPFSLTSQGEKLRGSNLNVAERRLLGMRPAGMEIADPENFKSMRWIQELKKEAKERKSTARKEMQKEE